MYSPIRIENIRFGLCWHQQYQFIARPWPKIRQSICNLHHWKCDYEYENSWIFKNMIGSNHLIQLPSCSRLLLVLQVGHSRHFLITSPNILTLQHQENSAIYFWWDMATIVQLFKIRTTASKRPLQKASIHNTCTALKRKIWKQWDMTAKFKLTKSLCLSSGWL